MGKALLYLWWMMVRLHVNKMYIIGLFIELTIMISLDDFALLNSGY